MEYADGGTGGTQRRSLNGELFESKLFGSLDFVLFGGADGWHATAFRDFRFQET